ncbi:MAG TPA: DNA-binding transcriptional regulator OxyR [Microscillaceae bacterium]|nr:DNA-binding transcriptional regulator OxyR [Microscillaceae bacterium]
MNVQQLEYIVAVDTYRHFAMAAEHCHITQPTLSMMIQKLEAELGCKIFDRSKQPIVPTEIGQTLIAQARRVLQEVHRLYEISHFNAAQLRGELHVGIIPTLAPFLIPLFLNSFLTQYPEIKLFIGEYTTEVLYQKLKNDQIDVAILATPSEKKWLQEDYLFTEEFVLYASTEEKNVLAKQFVLAEDIDPTRLVLLEEGHCMRSQIEHFCKLHQSKRLGGRVAYEAGSVESLKRIVEHQYGMTILPKLATLNFTPEQMAMVRPFAEPLPVRHVNLVSERSMPKQRLLKYLKESILANLPTKFNV